MNTDKNVLRGKTRRKMLWLYLRQGLRSLKYRKSRVLFSAMLIVFAVVCRAAYQNLIPDGGLEEFCQSIYKAAFVPLGIVIPLLFLILLGAPRGCVKISENLQRVSFSNAAGESPILLFSKPVPGEPGMREMTFDNCGLPLSAWEDGREKLAAGLNVHVITIEQGGSNRSILLTVMPADHQLPKKLVWNEQALSDKDFELVVGESVTGKVRVNLNGIPHILIGGSTGSGKTILLRSLLLQCIMKKAAVIVADFKGIDFHRVWREHCEIITEPEAFLARLDTVLTELRERKQLFSAQDCADIREYNAAGGKLRHIVIACDEVSELMDKTGAGKEEKDRIGKIEAALSTIARQGRAFGIHLLLATQRPDANVLSGQIKNNMDCRICGRADNVLSQIILDNTDAADVIPKNATGRFLMNDGTVFQGYFVDDEMIRMLEPGKSKETVGGDCNG